MNKAIGFCRFLIRFPQRGLPSFGLSGDVKILLSSQIVKYAMINPRHTHIKYQAVCVSKVTEFRNSSAEAKVLTANPTDLTNPQRAELQD